MNVLRFGLCVLIAFAVLAQGAVEVWSESIVEIGAALLLCGWVAIAFWKSDLEIYWEPLSWPILAFLLIGVFQLLFRASAYPFLTRAELLRAAACWIVFFVAAQVFRKRSELEGLAWFLVLFCFAVSLLGIAQYFTSKNQIYWIRDIGDVKPFGPYVNRNHFAGFVELTLPIGLAMLIFQAVKRELTPLLMLLTVVPIGALILSGSRAGMVGLAVEICVLMFLRAQRREAQKLRLGSVAAMSAAALILVAWLGPWQALGRFASEKETGVSIERRISMVHGAAKIFLAHPILGCGLGTLVAIYPRYETMYDGRVVDHVHDDYAEALAETGLLGAICGVVFLFMLYRKGAANLEAEQGHFSRALHAGGVAAVAGLVVHSFADFNLHILANALLFLVAAYLVCAPAVRPNSGRVRSGAAEGL